jgi:hypothetical protein
MEFLLGCVVAGIAVAWLWGHTDRAIEEVVTIGTHKVEDNASITFWLFIGGIVIGGLIIGGAP